VEWRPSGWDAEWVIRSGGGENENKGKEKKERVGSGNWVVLPCVSYLSHSMTLGRLIMRRLLLAIIAYFALGAYYNYTTYGASGVDLIPYFILLSRHLS